MASPEEWICGAIDAATGLATYPHFAPDGAELPYVIYQRSRTDREKTLDGTTVGIVGTFAVVIYADTYSLSKTISEAVRLAVDNFNGPGGGLTIARVEITDERDGDPVFFEGRDTAVFVVEQTYTIEWEE